MAEKNLNTKDSISKAKSLSDVELKAQINKTNADIRKQKVVPFSIPPALERHIGSTMFIAINGSRVVIPVDGKSHEIPEDLARLGQATINRLTT